MPKVGGGRTAAIEILVSNSRTREYIEKGEKEGRSITDAMNDGEMEGMQTFDKVLEKMIRNGTVTKEIGLGYATNSNNLALAISDMDHESPIKKEEVIVQAEEKSQMPEIDGFER
jgi:twitching motility protein PilT